MKLPCMGLYCFLALGGAVVRCWRVGDKVMGLGCSLLAKGLCVRNENAKSNKSLFMGV